jgi:shikimate dehydrogenase
MHEAEGARLGLRYIYRLIDLDRLRVGDEALSELLAAAEQFGFAGLNITYPLKQRVLGCLDELSPEAAAIGAVNTVVLCQGKRIGHNTDSWGFAESFRRQMSQAPLERVAQLGAGGAGMAVAHALLGLGARQLAIFDTDHVKASALTESLTASFGAGRAHAARDARAALGEAQGLVNATPIGMAKHQGMPVPRELLRRDLWVADVVYFPIETELLQAARRLGSLTMPGAGMAIHQAVKAFELITGLMPDPVEMTRQFEAA